VADLAARTFARAMPWLSAPLHHVPTTVRSTCLSPLVNSCTHHSPHAYSNCLQLLSFFNINRTGESKRWHTAGSDAVGQPYQVCRLQAITLHVNVNTHLPVSHNADVSRMLACFTPRLCMHVSPACMRTGRCVGIWAGRAWCILRCELHGSSPEHTCDMLHCRLLQHAMCRCVCPGGLRQLTRASDGGVTIGALTIGLFT